MLPNRITGICGNNGSGKTNLLDAVYYLCYTKSYFSTQQQGSAQAGTDGFRVTGEFDKANGKEVISCRWQQGKKEVFANQVLYDKPTDHIGKYAAVMIAPDDTELINGGSELRRKWLDGILSQADSTYFDRLLLYQRVLLQRNAWLKQEAHKPTGIFTDIEYYDQLLVECATHIHQKRTIFINDFIPILIRLYCEITDDSEAVGMVYNSSLNNLPMNLLLKQSLENDLRLQRTTKGIHRDDLEFTIKGMPAKQFASQGQRKSLLFSLKLAQFHYLANMLGYKPILLLDDIFEKLDQNRMEALMQMLRSDTFGQVLLTDTHLERVKSAFGDSSSLGFITL